MLLDLLTLYFPTGFVANVIAKLTTKDMPLYQVALTDNLLYNCALSDQIPNL